MPRKKYYPGYQRGGGIRGLQRGGSGGDPVWMGKALSKLSSAEFEDYLKSGRHGIRESKYDIFSDRYKEPKGGVLPRQGEYGYGAGHRSEMRTPIKHHYGGYQGWLDRRQFAGGPGAERAAEGARFVGEELRDLSPREINEAKYRLSRAGKINPQMGEISRSLDENTYGTKGMWDREKMRRQPTLFERYIPDEPKAVRGKPPSGIRRKLMRGLGRLAKLSPAALLMDQLLSPDVAGAGEVPERPRHSDTERQRAMASMMEGGDQLRELLSPGPERPASFSDMLHRRASGGLVGFQAGGQTPPPRKTTTKTSRVLQTALNEAMAQVRSDAGTAINTDSVEELPNGEGYKVTVSYLTYKAGKASGGLVGLQMGGPSGTQVTQSYVSPEVSQQYANLTDRIVQEGQRPYQQYGGQRLAGFTAPEAAAMAGTVAYGQGAGPQGTLQAGQTLGQAGQMIGGAYQGMAGLQPQYAQMAGQFGQAAQGALGQAQTGAQGMQNLAGRAELQGQLAGAGMRQTGAAAQTEQQQLGAEQEQRGRIAQTQMQGLGQQAQQAGQAALGAQQGFGTGMTGMGTAAQQLGQTAMGQMGQTGQQSQQQAQEAAQRMRDIGGQAPQLQKGADMSDYMSQYTKGVTDPQLQQLLEFQKMQGQELGSQAAGAGAFGGLRQGVQAATQAQDISQQAADIIGSGQQKAFESAQQAFQADRAAQQQAQQTGLSAEQQAAATQAGAQGQALQAQQAGVGAAQQGTAQQMQAQQQAAGMADVGAGRQLQGLQAQAGATAQGIGMGQQGLAAQQAAAAQGAQLGLQGQQQGFGAAQQGVSTGLAGLQAAGALGQQGYGTMGQLMGQQQGAIGAQGQAFGQMGQMGGQMASLGGRQGQLGQQQQAQQLQRLQAMQGAGAAQRGLQQQGLNMGYQDWQNQQNQNRQNINWQLGAMGSLPYQSTVSTSQYQPQSQPTGANAMIGAGLQGLDVYNTMTNRGNQGAGTPAP